MAGSGIWLPDATYLQTAGQLWAQQQTQNVHAGVNWAQQAMQDTMGRLQQMVPQVSHTPAPAPAAPAPVAPPPVEAPPPPMPAPPPVPIGGPTPAAGALPAPSDLTGAGITPPPPAPTPPPALMPTPAPAPSTPDVGQNWAQQQIQNLLNPSAPSSSSTPTPGAQPIPGLGTGLPPSTPSPPASPAATTSANAPAPGQLPPIDSSSPSAFAKSFAPYAQYAAQKLGVDPTWVAAMAASESNYGKAAGNELFGIKALPGQPGTSMQTHEGEYGGTQQNATFASYNSPLDAVDAYVDLLKNHYQGALGAQDLGTFVHGLKQGGYFTAAEDEYKGILSGISSRIGGDVQAGLQQVGTGIDTAKQAVGNAVTTGQTAVNTAVQGVQSAVARTSQFAMGLSSGDAMAFCGPAAAMAFAQSFGRNPTVAEAKQLAQQIGWNPDQGMAGPQSEVQLLKTMGVDAHMTQGVDWATVGRDASGGNPVILDTPGHYYYVDGYNQQTGQLHVGTSGTDLKGGSEWMTPDQINGMPQSHGGARAAIFADHPLAQSDGLAQSSARLTMGTMQPGNQPDLGSSIGQAVGSAVGNAPLPFLGGQSLSDIGGLLGQNSQQLQQGRDLVGGILSPVSSTSGTIQTKANSILQAVQDVGSQASQAGQDLLNQGQNALQNAQGAISQAPTTIQGILQQNAMTSQGIPNIGGQALEGAGNLLGQGQQALAGIGLQPGQSANLGPLQLGPMPADNSVLPLKLGGVDLTQPYNSDAATRALLGPNANPVVQSALAQALNPINAFFGPLGPLSGASAGAGGEIARQQAEAMGGDPTAQGVAQLAGGLVGGFAPSALERAVPAALSHGLGLMDVLSPPSVAYASTRGAGEPVTGAGMLDRALDQLRGYPEEIVGPIRDWASQADAPASQVAATVQRWMAENPAEAIAPQIQAGPAAARATATRAIGDLDAAVSMPRGSAGPSGVMPGQLGLFPDQAYQPLMPEGAGGTGVPSTAIDAGTQQWQRDVSSAETQRQFDQMQADLDRAGLVGDRPSTRTVDGQTVLPGMQTGAPVTMAERARLYHVGNVISSTATLAKVAMNSMVNPAWSFVSRGTADLAGASPLGRLAGIAPEEALGRARGSVIGAQGSMATWGQQFMQGLTSVYTRSTSLAARETNPVARAWATAWETPGALHNAFQTAGQSVLEQMEIGRLAGQDAAAQGLSGSAFRDEVARLIADPRPGWTASAQGVARRAVLRGELGTLGQALGNMAGQGAIGGTGGTARQAIGNVLFPVFRIGMNALTQGVEKSPLGLLGTGIDVARAAVGRGPYAAAAQGLGPSFERPLSAAVTPLGERLTNNLVGTAVTAALAKYAADGSITGAGPTDPQQRAVLLAQGWQPNSIRTPMGYVSYQGTPIEIPAGLVGEFADALTNPMSARELQSDPREVVAGRLFAGTLNMLTSRTGLETLGQITDMIHTAAQDPTQAVAQFGTGLVGNVLSGYVPMAGPLRDVAKATDPLMRQPPPGDLGAAIGQNIPFLREQVQPRLDVLGRTVANPQQGLGAILPTRLGAGADSPIAAAMSRVGVAPPGVPLTIPYGPAHEVRLTPQERQAYQQYRGQVIQQGADALVRTPKFQQLGQTVRGQEAQRAALEQINTVASDAAGKMVLRDIVRSPGAGRSRMVGTGVLAPVQGYGPDVLGNQYSDPGASARLAQHQALIQSLLGG